MISQFFFSVNLSFGGAVFGEPPSSIGPDMGGLVARGDGTATGNPNEVEGPRLKPRLGKFGVVGGGLVADPEGAGPLLNSAHRGHLRLVSVDLVVQTKNSRRSRNALMWPI